METQSVHQKNPKQAKKKQKQPLKVVYISNPIRVNTSASKFKDLVQELTGRDSDIDDISKFSEIEPADIPRTVMSATRGSSSGVYSSGAVRLQGRSVDAGYETYRNGENPFDGFDEVFTPQILDSFAGLVPSSSMFYEQYHGDTTFRRSSAKLNRFKK